MFSLTGSTFLPDSVASSFGGRSRLVFLIDVVDVPPMPRPLRRWPGSGVWLGLGEAAVAFSAGGGPGLGDLV